MDHVAGLVSLESENTWLTALRSKEAQIHLFKKCFKATDNVTEECTLVHLYSKQKYFPGN